MTDAAAIRSFYAAVVSRRLGLADDRVREAFAAVPRERFVGAGPWWAIAMGGYVQTPSDDLAFLYQDVVVALDKARLINNGEPSLHAGCLGMLGVKPGQAIVHVGAGTGYYTAILSHLTGPSGSVIAYEIDPELATTATMNLNSYANVTLIERSGVIAPLPACDAIYVNAGCTHPADVWLDALKPSGRLIFPLAPEMGVGAMLRIERIDTKFKATFFSPAMFIPCAGQVEARFGKIITEAFAAGNMSKVRSLRRGTPPDDTCWAAFDSCWLSTA